MTSEVDFSDEFDLSDVHVQDIFRVAQDCEGLLRIKFDVGNGLLPKHIPIMLNLLEARSSIELLSIEALLSYENESGNSGSLDTSSGNSGSLDISSGSNIADKDFQTVLKIASSRRLVELRVAEGQSLGSETCKLFVEVLPNLTLLWLPWLTALSLGQCYQITDACLKTLASGCNGLMNLELAGCQKITDKSLQALASGCHGLTNLNLAGCNEITDAGIKPLASGCQGLTDLNLVRCNQDEQPEFVQRGKQHFAIFKS
jgi:hypothetical protein